MTLAPGGGVLFVCASPSRPARLQDKEIERMIKHIRKLFQQRRQNIFRVVLIGGLTAGTLLIAATATLDAFQESHSHDDRSASPNSSKLIEIVRNATRQFQDVNAAVSAKYQPLFGCVTGPDHGAMGIHYINLALYGDGEIAASTPEALIYEPSSGGLRLVGVEYIVDATTWLAHHSAPPALEGQAFQLVSSPNRFGLPAFFELHVWAWRKNPAGAYVDWNNHVTCEGQ
jgi:hypothetical protein